MSEQRNELRYLREIEALEREITHLQWVITTQADMLAATGAQRSWRSPSSTACTCQLPGCCIET